MDMVEQIQAVDLFLIVMTVAVVISTAIGVLIGWYVLGIAREGKKLAQKAREKGEEILEEEGDLIKEVLEEEGEKVKEVLEEKVEEVAHKGEEKLKEVVKKRSKKVIINS